MEKIASVVNIRYWFKQKHWKRSKLKGKACLNIFHNGQGLKMNFVYTNHDGTRTTFDMPITAVKMLFDRANKIGYSVNSKSKAKWRLIEWSEKK